ncbi:MAG: hypothetical protein NXH75_06245, partial [Halobacteriovoraceae bacterium]|nr:hypothetical protein [Halobacteriovoraceae bacterium]
MRFFLLSLLTLSQAFFSYEAKAFDHFKLNENELENSRFKNFDLLEDTPLYREILGYLNVHRNRIAQGQLDQIDAGRDLRIWGGMNHVGINFNKGFGDFSIELKRETAPDLFDDTRWLVTDTFNIFIDASKVLSNLKNEEIIDISDKNLAAFAGITFKRSYKHIHFADSYEESLGFNLDKLFFAFKNFRGIQSLAIGEGEIIQKEDSFSLQAGGIGTIPLTSGLAAHAGALVKYQKMSNLLIQGLLPDERSYESERVRISSQKSKEFRVGVSAGLVADLLGVLQLTLLRFDFEYSLFDSHTFYLSLSDSDLDEISSTEKLVQGFQNLLKQKSISASDFAPYLVSEEVRKKELSRMKYMALIYGGYKDSKTEHIQITKDGKVKTFFRHNFERSQYRENIFSKLFNVVVKSFLKLNTLVNKSVVETDKVRMEYDSEKNLLKSKGDLVFGKSDSKLSVNFMRDYSSYKLSKRERKRLLKLLDHFSGADPILADNIASGVIKKSIEFSTLFSMGHDAMVFFHELPVASVHRVFDEACEAGRSGLRGFFERLLKTCEKKLKRKYDAYMIEWSVSDYNNGTYESCKNDFKRYKKRKFFVSKRRKRLF